MSNSVDEAMEEMKEFIEQYKEELVRKKIFCILLLIILAFLFPILISSAEPVYREDNTFAVVRLVVHISDIDTTENFATVEIYVFINNFPYNETYVNVWIIGGGSIIVPCNKAGNGFYQGKSNQTQWFLEGSGEIFPFDSYNICLKIYDVTYIGKNFSLSSNTEDHQAFFYGLKYHSLLSAWKTLGPGNPLIPVANLSQNEVKFVLKRSDSALLVYALEILLPIIACYYLLGATLLINPKKKLNERLTIYLSLFVFSSTFLFSIQKFLPYRLSLSFPEFLLSNLIAGNAFFGIFSIISSQSKKEDRWDIVGAVISLLVFLVLYLFTMFSKTNMMSSLIITYVILPAYLLPSTYLRKVSSKNRTQLIVYFMLYLVPLILFLILDGIMFLKYGSWIPLF